MAEDIEGIIRRVVREEFVRALGQLEQPSERKRAYTVQSLSEAYEVSVSSIRNEIARGTLRPQYFGRKPLVGIEEAERWFASLGD